MARPEIVIAWSLQTLPSTLLQLKSCGDLTHRAVCSSLQHCRLFQVSVEVAGASQLQWQAALPGALQNGLCEAMHSVGSAPQQRCQEIWLVDYGCEMLQLMQSGYILSGGQVRVFMIRR